MEDVLSDDILQIFATDQDLFFSDAPRSSTESSDNVTLKFFTKGSMASPNAVDIAEFLINQHNLNICGLSFKGNSVLFEISHSSQLVDWLVKLFEERHSNMKLNTESRHNILKICKGKFNLLINQTLIFLVVIPGSSAIMFPCQNNIHPYGLCNRNIANVIAGSLTNEPSQIILSFLNSRYNSNHPEIELIYGIRLEWNSELDTHNLRFLMKHSNISDKLLGALKDLFGSISFSPDTFHIIPTLLRKGIDKQLASGRDYSDVLKYIINNDILLSEVNEMTVMVKKPKNDSFTQSSSSSRRITTGHTYSATSSRSIFDRLQPRANSLTDIEMRNISMGFRRVNDHASIDHSSVKPKLKSIVQRISRK